jgi:hypothetical protein
MERSRIKHLSGKPSVILFENRGGKIGYTVVDTKQNEVSPGFAGVDGKFQMP